MSRGFNFVADGCCVVPGVVEPARVAQLRAAADALGQRWSEKVGDTVLASQGSMVTVDRQRDPAFAELILHPGVHAALAALGYGPSSFTDGYVISKPAHSPPLFWHLDWYGWDDPSAHEPRPPQVFVMLYLTDTSVANGCLRVLPGSHRRRHPLHDVMADGHSELGRAENMDRPEFAEWPGAVDVAVRAGDLVLGDARLLHAAHANTTDERRSLITLWFQPGWLTLPAAVQATLAAKVQPLPDTWPEDLRAQVTALHPVAPVGAKPLARSLAGP